VFYRGRLAEVKPPVDVTGHREVAIDHPGCLSGPKVVHVYLNYQDFSHTCRHNLQCRTTITGEANRTVEVRRRGVMAARERILNMGDWP